MAWEEELVGEVKLLLSNVSVQDSSPDVWLWHPNAGKCSTIGCIKCLCGRRCTIMTLEAVWHKSVPLKVSICVCCLFRNRWPTKDNLGRRGVIPLDSQLCVSGWGQNETAEHLIVHSPTFGSLWQHIKSGLGVYYVDPQHVMDHFHQFIYIWVHSLATREELFILTYDFALLYLGSLKRTEPTVVL
jgi:hypothetical protein